METDKKPANFPLSFVDWLKANPYVDCPITQYNNYLISHHLTVLSERIKNGATYTHCLKNPTSNDRDGFHFVITQDNIERIAKDYIKEIGL